MISLVDAKSPTWMRREFRVIFNRFDEAFSSNLMISRSSFHLELIREAERVRQSSSRNPKEKIDIYHEAAEACRSAGNDCEAQITSNEVK